MCDRCDGDGNALSEVVQAISMQLSKFTDSFNETTHFQCDAYLHDKFSVSQAKMSFFLWNK